MIPVDSAVLWSIAPRIFGAKAEAQREVIAAIGPVLMETLAGWGIATPLRLAHFLAQIAHESDGFCTTEEYASGDAYDTGRLAVRLGNTPEEDGDGERYKGRGLIQLTGHANYRAAGKAMKLPLEEQPELAAEPVTSLRIACWYWHDRGCNAPADRDDLVAVTRLINGGTNGVASRRAYLRKAKDAIARLKGGRIAADDMDGHPVLFRGCEGEDVATLQSLLADLGFRLAIDGDFGPATETAVRTWQARAGLEPDGICGPLTWRSLADSPVDGRRVAPAPEAPETLSGALARLWAALRHWWRYLR